MYIYQNYFLQTKNFLIIFLSITSDWIELKIIYNSPVPYVSPQQMHGQHGHRRSISSSSSSSSSSTSSSTSSSSSSSSTDTSAHRPGHKRDTKRKPRPSKRVAPTGDRSKLKKTKSASSSWVTFVLQIKFWLFDIFMFALIIYKILLLVVVVLSFLFGLWINLSRVSQVILTQIFYYRRKHSSSKSSKKSHPSKKDHDKVRSHKTSRSPTRRKSSMSKKLLSPGRKRSPSPSSRKSHKISPGSSKRSKSKYIYSDILCQLHNYY